MVNMKEFNMALSIIVNHSGVIIYGYKKPSLHRVKVFRSSKGIRIGDDGDSWMFFQD
jgi:hypothetical protein